MLRQMPRLTVVVLAGPVLAGLVGTLAPAFGILGPKPGLHAFDKLLAWPGVWPALRLSLVTGVVSTLLALTIALSVLAMLSGGRIFAMLRHMLSPFLAVPHAAAALGLAFLLAPSGWLLRFASPWATGFIQPPDWLMLNDPWGAAMILGLVAKEVPFLLLMALAALPLTDASRRMTLAATLGYGRAMGFVLTVLPPLYAQLRLPVYAVLAYAMTAVEIGMILGPSLPPPLSVQITHWMMDPTLAERDTAAAAALLQVALVILTLGLWVSCEDLIARTICACAASGWRGVILDLPLRVWALVSGGFLALALSLALAGLALWSFAGLWTFPMALPESLTLKTWEMVGPDLANTFTLTLGIALASTALGLILVLGCLEAEHRFALPMRRSAWVLLYLPLLVPQIAFLPGLQVFALRLGAEGSAASVAASHLVFVLPYVFLSLAGPFRAFPHEVILTGASLGHPPAHLFWHLRLPMLLAPILTATAIGLSVSIGQYLPSLLIGGGRIETLTTEAVALASGGNRRIIGAYGLMQMLLPALGFALALILPAMAYRNRRGMLTGGAR